MYYVYRYMHPDYPWLYVGKTIDLHRRIYSHDKLNSDNIDRKYTTLLLESTVYFITLDNSAQMDLMELYLIDKHKPYLNKKDKHDTQSILELKIPKWKRYVRSHEISNNNFNKKTKNLAQEIEILDSKIAELETARSNKIAEISSCEKEIECLINIESDFKKYKIEASSLLSKPFMTHSNKLFYRIDIDEINLIFQEFPESNLKFYLDIYNCNGDMETMISDKNGIWTYTNFNKNEKKFICKRDDLIFNTIQSSRVTSITHFYSKSLFPFMLLRTIYENRLYHLKIKLNDCSHMIKEYTFKELADITLLTKEGAWYEDKDKNFEAFVDCGEWVMFDLNEEIKVLNIESVFLKQHSISTDQEILYKKYIDKINRILNSNILWTSQKYKQCYNSINAEFEKCKKKIEYYSKKINTFRFADIKDDIA